MTQSKRSWDFGRFVQTLDFFDSIPVVSWVQAMMSGSQAPQPPQVQDGVLFDFSQADPEQVAIWGALDDVVMGGVSDSGFQAGDGAARFTGTVSTENSGGFASIRTRNFDPPLNLATYRGIELRVQGDGQRYKFFLRDRDGWDAIAYGYSFDTTPNEWVTVQIPFTELTPVFRAKTQPEAQPLDPGNIRSLQLMLSKFEYDKALNPHFTPGPFCLVVQTIAAFR
ncbi:CIA30 family protein [Nodosilinea sp. P-1105]|uniref:CIA30 family protein n=1 Tax=Nodosilinea sp. P-1105 TaxID=2546229 RepID=UPI00146A6DD1|nr:CIA30 family protein [Nodosilinea sp. P-1105]NMF82784.1 CIA30 family protein [Nodosilinea sp. P-1105]